MALLLLLLAAVGVASGTTYDGLRAKFNQSTTLIDKEYYFNLPRTVPLAQAAGWRRVARPAGVALPALQMYCRSDDVTVCLLYVANGFIAGLQVAFPTDAVKSVPGNPATRFIKWSGVANGGVKRDYWTSSVYYVSEASLKSGAGPSSTNGNTVQDAYIWAQDPTAATKLMRIPLNETGLSQTLYKKESCITSMGTHYYYNMTPQLACAVVFPWFPLVKDGIMIGVGFQAFGQKQQIGSRDWLENVIAAEVKYVIPTAPTCLTEWVGTYGLTSLHTYFVNQPWNIEC